MIEFVIYYFSNSSNLLHSTQTVVIPKKQIDGKDYDTIIELIDEKRKYSSMDCVYSLADNQRFTFPMTIKRLKKENQVNNFFG